MPTVKFTSPTPKAPCKVGGIVVIVEDSVVPKDVPLPVLKLPLMMSVDEDDETSLVTEPLTEVKVTGSGNSCGKAVALVLAATAAKLAAFLSRKNTCRVAGIGPV